MFLDLECMSETPESPEKSDNEEPMVVPTRRRRSQEAESAQTSRKGVFVVVALVMAGAGVVGLVFTSAPLTYAKQVNELINEKHAFAGRTVRAQGVLVHGTIKKSLRPTCEYQFKIASGGAELPVSFKQCTVPDSFRDVPNTDTEVTVEGQILADGSFEATNVLAKCASKYSPEEMKARAAAGAEVPYGMEDM